MTRNTILHSDARVLILDLQGGWRQSRVGCNLSRSPSGEKSPVGPRDFQLAVLITAREIDQQYEWSAHEPAGLRQGLEQSVIDVVKYDRDVAGLSDKDATLIRFGRALFRDHQVSSEVWQKMMNHFGRQHTVQLMTIMDDYFRVGFMLNAVDQHLPPGRKALLPPLKK